MPKFPALPLFVDAYWVDAGHLSDAEHGRYLMMLMQMWIAPYCRLPNDDKWLARKFRRTVEDVQRDLRPIIVEFMQTDGNWITQKRLQKEWVWCQNKRYQNSASAKSRWKQENPFSERNANAYANAMPPTLPKKDINYLLSSSVTPSEQAPGSLATAPLDSALAHPASEKPPRISGKSLTSAAIAPETDAEKAARREAYLKHKAAQAERDRLADEAAKTEAEFIRKNVAAGGHTARALADMEARKIARQAFEDLANPPRKATN